MSEKPTEIYCGKNLEKLKNNLSIINSKVEKMNADLKHGADIIKEYCTKLKKEVKTTKECLIQHINDMSVKYLDKISKYESDCLAKFHEHEHESSNERNKLSFYNFISESHLFYKSWIYYINKGHIDEKELLKAIGYTESRLFKIKKEQVGINYFLFNKDILIFKESNLVKMIKNENDDYESYSYAESEEIVEIDGDESSTNSKSNSILGQLYHEKIHGINFSKLEKFDLTKSFDEKQPGLLKVCIECMEDMGLLFGCIDSNSNFKLKLFSLNGVLIKNYFNRDDENIAIAEPEHHVSIIRLNDFKLTKTKTNLIVLYKEMHVANNNDTPSNESNENRLEILNDVKNKRYSIKCSLISPLLSSNESNIFLFEQVMPSIKSSAANFSSFTLYIYDFELNLIKSVNHNLAFIEKPILQFECEYEKIYLLDENNLTIINKNGGELIFDIQVEEKMRFQNKFSISHQEVVIMNELKKKIVYYSKVNGNVLYEDELVNCNSKSLVMACEKLTNRIIFFDKAELFLYI